MTPRVPLALICLAVSACTDGSGGGRGAPPPTAILVDPARFLGDVPCLDAPGAMRRYVATLFDVSAPPAPFDAATLGEVALPSSAPAPCHLGVRFTLVTPGRRYVTEIDAYDAEDISPLAPGSRVMIDASGSVVRPRWITACGRGGTVAPGGEPGADGGAGADGGEPGADGGDGGATSAGADADAPDGDAGGSRPTLDGPVTVLSNLTKPIRGCAPLVDLDPSRARTGLLIDIRPALGDLACGSDVTAFRAVVRGSGQELEARCDAPAVLEPVTPGLGYTIDVEAERTTPDGGSALLVTTCFQIARSGVVLRAACDPLRPAG